MHFLSVKWLSASVGESANVQPLTCTPSSPPQACRQPPKTMKLLLIEDDASMQKALQRALSRRGIEVLACADGNLALAQWTAVLPDVVVLDLSLPGLDGLQVLELARKQGLRTPVLILTARGTVGDRIMGLNLGADDYLPKPFDLDEQEARLRALGRRRPSANPFLSTESSHSPIMGGALRYEKESGAIYHDSLAMELTPRELALLQALMARPGHAVSKEKLFELVFPGEVDVQYEAIE
ncbi:MAG: response regulator transcription factor, partial [Polaromonas sp.]|nr:response regulator transcription factor [Polaromonas sp.]